MRQGVVLTFFAHILWVFLNSDALAELWGLVQVLCPKQDELCEFGGKEVSSRSPNACNFFSNYHNAPRRCEGGVVALQTPCLRGATIVNDDSDRGGGRLRCGKSRVDFSFHIVLKSSLNCEVPVEAWNVVQVPSTEQRDSLERGGKEVSSRS
jgi:hypothetical protein